MIMSNLFTKTKENKSHGSGIEATSTIGQPVYK